MNEVFDSLPLGTRGKVFFFLPFLFVSLFSSLLFFLGSSGVWTQGLSLARQALYYLNHASSLPFFNHVACTMPSVLQNFYLCLPTTLWYNSLPFINRYTEATLSKCRSQDLTHKVINWYQIPYSLPLYNCVYHITYCWKAGGFSLDYSPYSVLLNSKLQPNFICK
jgi:hypothetical protein